MLRLCLWSVTASSWIRELLLGSEIGNLHACGLQQSVGVVKAANAGVFVACCLVKHGLVSRVLLLTTLSRAVT